MSQDVRCFLGTWDDIHAYKPGAMLWVETPPAGRHLLCVMPDGRIVNVSHWDLTGDAPNVTARPSIKTLREDGTESWHGWLTDGALRSC